MGLAYEEWLPAAAALRGIVTAYWHVCGDPSDVPAPAVLPDGHVELVFNLGDAVALDGPAYTGPQPDRAVVGLLSQTLQMKYLGAVETFGVRFHPARGPSFFGLTATALAERLFTLREVSAPLDATIEYLLAGDWRAQSGKSRAALDGVLADQLARALPADMDVVLMVDRLMGAGPVPSVEEIAEDLGLSPRQVQRRFVTAVGIPPKRFVRVIRFARLWQMASMSPPEAWASLAVDYGFADQAHMVREFRSFGAEPPAHFFKPEWYGATELSRASGPAKGQRRPKNVRSVQYRRGQPRL